MPDWTSPRTWTTSELVTAAIMNTHVRDNLPVFYWKTTTKTVVNSTSATDLFNDEITVAAGAMGSNQRLRGWASGDLLNNGAVRIIPRWSLVAGATDLVNTGTDSSNTLASSANRMPFGVKFEIQQLNATNAQEVSIDGWMGHDGAAANFTTGTGIYKRAASGGWMEFKGRNATTIDFASAQALKLKIDLGEANASYDLILRAAKVVIGA